MAILETNGQLSVLLKADIQPINESMQGIQVQAEHGPHILFMDGKTLEKLGYTEEWLRNKVKKQGANNISDVFLAQVDSNDQLYVDLYGMSTLN